MTLITNGNNRFSAGLYSTLIRRIPPRKIFPQLQIIVSELTDELRKGNIKLTMTNENLRILRESGWLEGENSPLLKRGNQVGLRKWIEKMDEVEKDLIDRLNDRSNKKIIKEIIFK